jgi:SPP1 gp7 family putative phage head morphogenesis protein
MAVSIQDKILRNTLQIESFATSVSRDVAAMLAGAEESVLRKLQRARPEDVFKRQQLSQALSEIGGTLNNIEGDFSTILTDARRSVLEMEYSAIQGPFLSEVPDAQKALVQTRLPVNRLEALAKKPLGGRTLEDWVSRTFGGLQKGLRTSLGSSLAQGESVQKAADRLRKEFGLSRNRADVLARTSLLQSAADSREEFYDDNSDVIEGFQYLATLDIRTCEICAPDDGRVEKTLAELPKLLRHPRCRCVIVPVTALSDLNEARPSVTKQEFKKTNHKDGSTSTKSRVLEARSTTKNFNQFFNSQPDSWKREWLGDERFDLWKSGELTSLDQLSKGDRVLNVDQLRRKLHAD